LSSVVALAAHAQNNPMPSNEGSTKSSSLNWGDKHFITKASEAGMEEVTISRVAAEKSTSPEVKELAQKIISDHESVNSELTSLATTFGVSLPSRMERHDEKLTEKWQKKDAGTSFDKAYLKQMVSDHEDAIELFSKGARSNEAQISAVATKALPALHDHYNRAKELRKRLGD